MRRRPPTLDSVHDHALLIAEALSILTVAAQKGTLDGASARALARACLERDPVGRLALAVLDGGVFAPARLVELATFVAKTGGDVTAAPENGVQKGDVSADEHADSPTNPAVKKGR